jgi:hypothetical protein
MRGKWWSIGALALAPLILVACEKRDVPTANRPDEAVVLTGSQVGALQGIPPNRLVAYAFHYGTWQQVPVQVDERAVLDIARPKNATAGKTALFYTDPNTWTGADPNPALDADDEIAFMSRDMYGQAHAIDDDELGVHAPLVDPPHVVAGSGVEVKATDPLVTAGSGSWVYLFRSDGTLDPAAGRPPLVDYDFVLLSGDYKSTYKIAGGTNPENSSVTTARYSAHFSDRWINDSLRVSTGGATNVDVLDRHKSGFAGTCDRTEGTFSAGGGAFIANKSGPVRAIRSYLGANSGTYSQRDEIMYEGHMDVANYLRVHQIPPLRDWMDYSADAIGMQYLTSTSPAGVTIDGIPDSPPPSLPTWEMVKGAPGSIVYTNSLVSDIPSITTNIQPYYSDDSTPAEVQCTGDAFQYGASGSTVNQNVPNTDPTIGAAATFTSTRHMTFLAPETTVATAAQIGARAAAPLAFSATPFAP